MRLTVLECEEESGKVATSCWTHPVTSLGKDTQQILGKVVRQFSKPFDI
jgi:hypothetical protein